MSGPARPPPTAPGLGPPEEGTASAPPRWILYVDLDAYYVTCELRDRPQLKGRPVIVGPPPSAGPTRGVVLSASYEARPFGVHSALPVRIAARLCPDAVWIPPDFPKYERTAEEVRALLRRHSPDVVPYSIDEAAVTVGVPTVAEAVDVARSIQRELGEKLRLTASIGVATTRVVAKMASDKAKPGGLLAVPPENVAEFVAPLPIRAVPGVGPRTEEILARHGIRTVGDLARQRTSDLVRDLGGFAHSLVQLARGNPKESPDDASGPRSRSTDRTLERDATSWEELEPIVRSLAHRLGEALEREGLRYASTGVAFRWSDFDRSQRTRALPAAREGPTVLVEETVRLARSLWEEERAGRGRAVRTVSVRAERLVERTQQQASLDQFDAETSPPARTGRADGSRSASPAPRDNL
jgi:nucleotidyltransferase/DNA polymerase involved in DNA repair